MTGIRDARAEAAARLGGRYDVRVLEPSPPAVQDGPWFADDPVGAPAGAEAVLPLQAGGLTWHRLAANDPALAAWCADRWLGAWRRLPPLPSSYVATRLALHRLAVYVLSPARHAANGKIGLRYTHRGFGTPFFGHDEQVRVEDADLVIARQQTETRAPITTLAAAATAIGVDLDVGAAESFDVPPPGDPHEPLGLDEAAVRSLGDWFGFVTSVLEEVRAAARQDPAAARQGQTAARQDQAVARHGQTAAPQEPGRVQLWPEHFDAAVDVGDEAAGQKVTLGGSPGDESHPEPYLYVLPWAGTGEDVRYWSLAYGALLRAGDPRAAALAFFDELRGRLTA